MFPSSSFSKINLSRIQVKAYKIAKNQSEPSYHQVITRDNEISYTEQIGYLCMSIQVESESQRTALQGSSEWKDL